MVLAAFLVSVAALIFTAATWWYREWTRVRVTPVLLLRASKAPGGLSYGVGVRVTNRGRVPIALRATGLYWSKEGGEGHTWEPTPGTIIASGASFVTADQEATEWWFGDARRRTRMVEVPLVGWAQLDSGRPVESQPGLVLESIPHFPVPLAEPLTYYRAERWWESALREWLGVERDRRARTPSIHDRPIVVVTGPAP
jgi:hypothetical protein